MEHGKLAYKYYRKEIYKHFNKKLPKWNDLDQKHKEIWEGIWFTITDTWADHVLYNKKQIDEIKKKARDIKK